MESKSIFKSKTLWVNVAIGAAVPILSAYGIQLTPTQIAEAVAAANVALRLITQGPVHVLPQQ